MGPAGKIEEIGLDVAGAIRPDASGWARSPPSFIAPARVSQNRLARRTTSSSVSRIDGLNAPTQSTCAPGFSHAPRTAGSTTAWRRRRCRAPYGGSRSATARTGKPSAASSAASASARSGRWFQIATSVDGPLRRMGADQERGERPGADHGHALASRPGEIARRQRRGRGGAPDRQARSVDRRERRAGGAVHQQVGAENAGQARAPLPR